jgi:hypothetical protein
MCDFSAVPNNTVYNITNTNTVSGGASEVMQFRINQPSKRDYRPVADTLNNLVNLQEQWEASAGKIIKDITMSQVLNSDGCPTALTILEDGMLMDVMYGSVIESVVGTVEKWTFKNPTSDVHPFHLHIVHMQCGVNDSVINTNVLKDNVPIPMAVNEGDGSQITYVCYVATMPSLSLIVNSSVSPTGFGFSLNGSYVAHCHTLEHEDNSMMTYFALVNETDSMDMDKPSNMADKSLLLLLILIVLVVPPVLYALYHGVCSKKLMPTDGEEGVSMSG